ncbi:hypothetical protein A2U01_0037489, partial [Trifolium medium]|nr:hypothetical protein [Trifolium medium]
MSSSKVMIEIAKRIPEKKTKVSNKSLCCQSQIAVHSAGPQKAETGLLWRFEAGESSPEIRSTAVCSAGGWVTGSGAEAISWER